MSMTIMVEMRCSGTNDNPWQMVIERPLCVPCFPPVGSVIVFETKEDELVTPDECTIESYYFVEGEDFIRCKIDEIHVESHDLHWQSFLKMADRGGWKRSS